VSKSERSYSAMKSLAWSANAMAAFPLARTRMAGLCDRLATRLVACADNGVTSHEFIVSERIVENAVVASYVRPSDCRVLDFGGYEGTIALQLAAMGHRVTVWDQRPYPFKHPNINVLVADIFGRDWANEDPFDVVYSISTVEHLGLGHYGDQVVDGGDAKALTALWEMVRPGGRLIVTVPAGKPTVQRGYRVYDERTLRAICPQVAVLRFFAKDGRQGMWSESTADSIATIEYSAPFKPRPCEAMAVMIADKPL